MNSPKKVLSGPYVMASSERESVRVKVAVYGWGYIKPRALQVFVSAKWCLAFFSTASFIQGVIVNGLLHYFLPMIERRFNLSSKESGFMSGAYDIASVICLIPITYLGGKRDAHKPLFVGRGVIVMGTGCLIFASPAFLAPPYNNNGRSHLCNLGSFNPAPTIDGDYSLYFYLLFIGNLLHGVGATPIYTLAVTFIDESVSVHRSSMYLGIYYVMAVMGPFAGFAAGGFLSKLDGDIQKTNDEDSKSQLTPDSPAWVGCWWLGFIVAGFACFLFSIPILGIPKELPGTAANRKERDMLHPDSSLHSVTSFISLHALPQGLFIIITNLKFLFITLGGCCEAFILAGMGAFLTKILQQQFALGSGGMAVVMSITSIPSALGGILIGGWVVKHFKIKLEKILLMIICLMSLSFLCILGLLLSCPNTRMIGITDPYPTEVSESELPGFRPKLKSKCNEACNCNEVSFSPLCGVDGRTYFSPCLAGCTDEHKVAMKKVFSNCSCILEKAMDGHQAKDLPCHVPCPVLPLFILLIFSYQALAFCTLVPAITSTLRVVRTDHRALAMGVQWIVARLLGSIPGPIVFGAVIDEACVHWYKSEAKEEGTCLHYDHSSLARYLYIVTCSAKVLQVFFFFIAYLQARTSGY